MGGAASRNPRSAGASGFFLASTLGLTLALAPAAFVTGCGAEPGRRSMVERIGGEPRVRSFASATAYEAYLRSELALRRGAFELAARQLELARMGDPSDAYLPARHAEVLALGGDLQGALTVAREATQRFPQGAAGWLVLASLRARTNDPSGATAAWSRALECAPEDPEVRAEVARGQGADGASIAHARTSSARTRPGDRSLAARERALHEGEDPAEVASRSARRTHAARAWARGEWARVDRLLTPLVAGDPSAVSERVRLIEARVRDGRINDAAPLVSGVSVRAARVEPAPTHDHGHGAANGSSGVRVSERARLWLLVGQQGIAAEEAQRALRDDPQDALALYVLGVSLASERSTAARGLAALARIAASSPHFVDARIAAAQALDAAGLRSAADEVLARALAQLAAAADPTSRDRLRAALAIRALMARDPARATEQLASIESDEGRQLRGVLRATAALGAPALAERDLRVRTGDAWLDARSDALRAGLCLAHTGLCPEGEAARALEAARSEAPEAPETLRALALATRDPREAESLRRTAAERAPVTFWNGLQIPSSIASRPAR